MTAIFVTLRIYARIIAFRRIYTDDGLVFFAWVVLLINTIIWQERKEALYENIAVSTGQLYPPPADFPSRVESYLRSSVVVIVFFYTGLWSVKLSFLIFFRRLGRNVLNQLFVWWAVLVITVGSYLASLGTIVYQCLAFPFSYIQCEHSITPWLVGV